MADDDRIWEEQAGGVVGKGLKNVGQGAFDLFKSFANVGVPERREISPNYRMSEWTTGPKPWTNKEFQKTTTDTLASTGNIPQYAPGPYSPTTPSTPATTTTPTPTLTPQQRLEQLEATSPTPAPTGILPLSGMGAYETRKIGGTEYRGPASILYPTPPTSRTQQPYQLPDDIKGYFDETIRGIMQPTKNEERLRNQAQGFGIPMGVYGAENAARGTLAQIEKSRRDNLTQLASTLSHLMTEPGRFNIEAMRNEIARQRGETEARVADISERRLISETEREGRKAPQTVGGYEGLEHVTKTWNPETRQWETVSRGALPISVGKEHDIINPQTGGVIRRGSAEGGKFKESLGLVAYKSYYDQLEKIENDPFMTDEQKAIGRNRAGTNLIAQMKRLGHGDIFSTSANQPSIEGFIQAARQQGSKMSDEDLQKAFREKYGQ